MRSKHGLGVRSIEIFRDSILMKKLTKTTTLSLLVAFGLPLASLQAAHAADDSGTVHFNGKVLANTCTLVANQINVDMGSVLAKDFKTAGTSGPNHDVPIQLTGCGSETTGATVTFKGTGDDVKPDYLKVGTGAADDATGIGIELLDKNNTEVALNQPSIDYGLKEGNNDLLFKARYISTAANVTAGNANSEAQFDIQYR